MQCKFLLPIAVFLTAAVPCHAAPAVQGDNFDVLGSVMETRVKEINAKDALDSSKDEAIKFREKVTTGWWEYMQAKSGAKPGEYCSATFMRANRVKNERQDSFSDGMMVVLFGPGGNYRGALLGFAPLDKDNAFPKLQNGSPVLVTLKQGNVKPATLNAIYTEIGPFKRPLLLFAVPSIEALMKGMEDNWRFQVVYQDQTIADIEWHDGLKARDELTQCLAGKPFDHGNHSRE